MTGSGEGMMDGNRPAAVFASIEQIGIGQVGDVPDAGHALLIQEMHAFDERAAALLGVSASSSVVRSMQRAASLRAKRFDPRLTERVANSAARASKPTASTDPTHGNLGSWGIASKTLGQPAPESRRRVYET
jgi:hypothetical protein